ncbi:protein eva-1 homolog A isoform X2 [Cyclopterus lumpus]|uniref:protein eva-1 homolog A isoform X2 n=1 Tax=Cyclopterus lumpus TaxID=8103 RepID=UPI0014860AED|nr:protein eva-1 homolog A isoform X2 [Cyclopterus lumpus]
MALLSNILAAYTFIADQPERTALVFLGGVCVGLFFTLCAIVFQIHCRADCHYDNMAVVATGGTRPAGDSESEDWDDTSDLSSRRRRRFERALLHATMFTSAEELDRAQRLEERERILREIWMNGQPDISTVTQSLNRYY